MSIKSEFLRTMQERGFLYQCTNLMELDNLFDSGSTPAYIGFDCTAPGLHVGSLIQIMILKWLKELGHKPIVLIGSATTKIGDPTGKDEARKILSDEEIETNSQKIMGIFEQFDLCMNTVEDNTHWINSLKWLDFIRDCCRYFSVNKMMGMDSVKNRLEREQSLSLLELNYMVAQAYDFIELNKRYNCKVQIGGSDQWGNIITGIELGHKMNDIQLYGLTTPLLTTAEGAKMGKTTNGAVWLNAELLSPYDYWQFWRNTNDADVIKFLKLFTMLPLNQIDKLEKLKGQDINKVKILLANEATKMCHGEESAKQCEETAMQTFEIGMLAPGLPVIEVDKGLLFDGVGYGVASYGLIHRCLPEISLSEARKLIRNKGVKINNKTIFDEYDLIMPETFVNNTLKLSIGKKKHYNIKLR